MFVFVCLNKGHKTVFIKINHTFSREMRNEVWTDTWGHLLVTPVQFSSRWYLCTRKSPYFICAPPHLSEVFPMLPLKWFQCPSDKQMLSLMYFIFIFKEDHLVLPLFFFFFNTSYRQSALALGNVDHYSLTVTIICTLDALRLLRKLSCPWPGLGVQTFQPMPDMYSV